LAGVGAPVEGDQRATPRVQGRERLARGAETRADEAARLERSTERPTEEREHWLRGVADPLEW
jgi:hypothetical protein